MYVLVALLNDQYSRIRAAEAARNHDGGARTAPPFWITLLHACAAARRGHVVDQSFEASIIFIWVPATCMGKKKTTADSDNHQINEYK